MILGVWATHRTASTRLIERLTVTAEQLPDRLRLLKEVPGVRECFVLSTCNRVEVYVVPDSVGQAEVVAAAVEMLAAPAQLPPDEIRESIVVESGDAVVRHLLAVTSGLDSMVVGEYQIVAQVREAMRTAAEVDSLGPVLANLIQAALRTSKRARSETTIGATGRSMVSVGLERAAECLGDLELKSGLLIGAGRMGMLAGPLLREAGVSTIVVTNRTERHAQQLAEKVWGIAVGLPGLIGAMSAADVIVSSTGAPGYMITVDDVTKAMSERPDAPMFILDLALPRDVEPAVRDIPNVTLVDIEDIGAYLRESGAPDDVAAAWSLVDASAEEFRRWREQSRVAPVIGALRAVASQLVESEVRRLHSRLPQLDSRAQRETDAAVRRAVGKLLHTPTVRVKELATGPHGSRYVEALTVLFDLESEMSS
jgi:glutamyl-tRNA reductase